MSEYNDAGLIINGQRQINAAQNKIIIAKIESQTILKDRVALLQEINSHQPVAGTEMRWQDAQTIETLEINAQSNVRRRQQAEVEVAYYKDLLSKPMHEIAVENEDFKKAYVLQQQLLADWMVSQKAFKELAIDLGLQLGKTKEEILEQGVANKEKVLNNTTKHNSNAEDSKIISPHIEALKNKINK